MIVTIFISSILISISSAIAALLYLRRSNKDEFNKTVTDVTLKMSVVTFGVIVGLVGFFGQRWLEDVNEQIQEANEAIGNIDIIQSEYMSAIEAAYSNNELEFAELFNACHPEFEASKDDRNYCEEDGDPKSSIPFSTTIDAADFFDYEMPEKFYPDFSARIYEQRYIKRNISPDLLHQLFVTHNYAGSVYSIIRDEVARARKSGQEYRSGDFSENDMIAPDKKEKILKFERSICCSVRLVYEQSKHLAAIGSSQAKNLCETRRGIVNDLNVKTDVLVRFLSKSRFDDINRRMRNYDNQDACSFIPEKLDKKILPSDPDPLIEIPTEVINQKPEQ